MMIKCLGGCREVGRNAFLVQGQRERMLLEYGLRVDTHEPPLPVKNVDSILLSHTHLDHCGSLPMLFRKFSKKQNFLFSTPATFDQVEMLLKDSLKIANIKGLTALFSEREMAKMRKHRIKVTYGQQFSTLSAKVDVLDAGHIPGSAMFIINIDGKRIMYTGDYNLHDTRLLKGANINGIKDIDLLMMETTYSSREHPNRKETEKNLLELVKTTVDNGGTAIIPSFAVGRAAEVIMVLDKLARKMPVFLDGMARKATEIAAAYPELLRDKKELKQAMRDVRMVKGDRDRKAALSQPCAIVTTGGCIDGGPVVHYIKRRYTDTKSSLIFTGFMIPRTAGRYLQDTGRFVNEDMDLKVKMSMHFLDFSAHCGRSDLFETIQTIRPNKVLCMHGDNAQRFATELRGRYEVDAIAPKIGDTIKL